MNKISFRLLCAIIIVALMLPAGGCVPFFASQLFVTSKTAEESVLVPAPTVATADTTVATITEPESISAESTENFFSEAAGEYVFASGAGAWGNVLTLNSDGSFRGEYQNSDMAFDEHNNEEYGIVYECDYEGAFSSLEKIDEHSYKAELSYLKKEGTIGDKYIEYVDSTRTEHIISYCCGLEEQDGTKAQEIIFYLPGTPVSELEENARYWAHIQHGVTELPYYVIYCPELQTGFRGPQV